MLTQCFTLMFLKLEQQESAWGRLVFEFSQEHGAHVQEAFESRRRAWEHILWAPRCSFPLRFCTRELWKALAS